MKLSALALTITAVASSLSAGTLYLDTNGSAAGFGSTQTVNWTDAVWTSDPTGQSATVDWIAGSDANITPASYVRINLAGFSFDVASITLGSGTAEIINSNPSAGQLTHNGELYVDARTAGSSLSIYANIDIGTNTLTNDSNGDLTIFGTNTIGNFVNAASGTATTSLRSAGGFGTGAVTHVAGTLNLNGNNPNFSVLTVESSSLNVIGANAFEGTVILKQSHVPGTNQTYTDGSYSNGTIIMRTGTLGFATSTNSVILEGPDAKLEFAQQGISPVLESITAYSGTIVVHAGQNLISFGDFTMTAGNYTEPADGYTSSGVPILQYYIGNTDAGLITVLGTAQFAGVLDVRFEPDFDFNSLNGEDRFINLFSLPYSFVGTFDEVILPTLPEGYTWDTSELYGPNRAIWLMASNVPEPATAAALAGLLALTVTATRRRRHNP